MSNQNLTWQEMQFLFNLTGKPIEMGTLPAGYCWIYDEEKYEHHGLPENSDAVLIAADRLDQRTVPFNRLPPFIRSSWLTEANTRDHGENSTGAFRYVINGYTGAIIPEPSLADLKQIIENFGSIKLDTYTQNQLKISINT